MNLAKETFDHIIRLAKEWDDEDRYEAQNPGAVSDMDDIIRAGGILQVRPRMADFHEAVDNLSSDETAELLALFFIGRKPDDDSIEDVEERFAAMIEHAYSTGIGDTAGYLTGKMPSGVLQALSTGYMIVHSSPRRSSLS